MAPAKLTVMARLTGLAPQMGWHLGEGLKMVKLKGEG
jgi:hypothetical protein